MLHAIGFPNEAMPQLLVHGWWNLGGAKMSKSAGNVIDPNVLVEKYGTQAVRYYLMERITTGQDADFSEKFLVSYHNGDLADQLGNLLNRTLNMVHRYRDGTIQRVNPEDLPENELQKELCNWSGAGSEFEAEMKLFLERFNPRSWLNAAMARVVGCNGLVEMSAPWKLAKDEAQRKVLDAVLYLLVESLRLVAVRISPVLPKSAHGIFDQLNWKMELSGKEERFSLADTEWGGLPDGHVVGKPVPLFPRIEVGEGV